jgi:hypothetical protein
MQIVELNGDEMSKESVEQIWWTYRTKLFRQQGDNVVSDRALFSVCDSALGKPRPKMFRRIVCASELTQRGQRSKRALQSLIQINAVADGYDPTIGIMHEGRDGPAAFVLDLMEPERPMIDRKVLEFIKGHVFGPADFVIRSDGVCRLNPEMARCVVATVGLERAGGLR